MAYKLEIVGGGKMGSALAGGLIASGWAQPAELVIVEPSPARAGALPAELPGVRVESAPVAAADVVLAVKPDVVVAACGSITGLGVERVLSIAAGVRLATIENALGSAVRVVRAMPNTPALVGAGAAAIAAGSAATDADLAWAEEVLGAVGTVVRVGEGLLDAVTGLSGSGPAYVFLVAEALIEAGVLNGIPRDASRTLAIQTLLGSARLLAESGDSAETLRAAVTSPGGTTAAGLRALEDRGVRAAFLAAVTEATRRSRELSGA